jgi:hypothetical protein
MAETRDTEPNEPEPQGRVGRRAKPRPAGATPAPLTKVQRAQRALATQNKPLTLVNALNAEQVAALAASLGPDGLAAADSTDEAGNVTTPGTARVVRDVLDSYYAERKATVDALDVEGPGRTPDDVPLPPPTGDPDLV